MTTIYVSSTDQDLKDHRRAVFDALRKGSYQVKAMDDYIAADQQPLKKCLADVASADIYVGIFAFRYGYIPPLEHDNPERKSITELEFRHAEKLGKPCLTFLLRPDAPVGLSLADAFTGEGEKGERINQLREYLQTEKLASFFSTPHELVGLVLAAVASHLAGSKETQSQSTVAVQEVPTPNWDIELNGSPYPGLMHFTRKYKPVFFGREVEVGEILDRLYTPEGHFLIISGDSGVGKSSIVSAGVVPRLEESGLPANKSCLCVRMLPSQGTHPFNALMAALSPYAMNAGLEPYTIAEELKASPANLSEVFSKIISQGTEKKTLVLFLDQMEELFTTQDSEQSKVFLTALYDAAQEGVLWTVATIRSDHLHHCHDHSEMRRVLNSHCHYALGRVERFMMYDMIVKPAACAGLAISDRLAKRIVDDTASEPGSLPLLAFVLDQLFQGRECTGENGARRLTLTKTVYDGFGGVSGAIAEHAKTVEAKLRKEFGGKASEMLPEVLESLVHVNPEGLPSRRRPSLADFSSECRPLVALLVKERLLSTEGEGESSTVAVSHEKLFEAWPTLREYISKNKRELMDQAFLESRARRWERLRKPVSSLAMGRELRDFRGVRVRTELAKQYVEASKRARWVRSGKIAILAVLVVMGGAWLWREGLADGVSTEIGRIITQGKFNLGLALHLVKVSEPDMVPVAPGSFQMGNVLGDGAQDEQPVRTVHFAKAFLIGRNEVTFEQYDQFAEATRRELPKDEGWGRGKRPVINVHWMDAFAYTQWLSAQTGKRYRLPTEAEWEYVARSRGLRQRWAGTSEESALRNYAWYHVNSNRRTQLVGTTLYANGLGVHDMSGNVWEWVEDCWHRDYKGAPENGSAWLETDDGDCGLRVVRGGSWLDNANDLRSSNRDGVSVGNRTGDVGFRLVQDR